LTSPAPTHCDTLSLSLHDALPICILRMHAIRREDVDEVFTGDIAAAVGLKVTTTGDTLSDEAHPILLESITFPEPVISVAIEPRSEEHTSELQSRVELVCRLLLEK